MLARRAARGVAGGGAAPPGARPRPQGDGGGVVASDAAAAFGAEDVVTTFVQSPEDAVTVASEECCEILGLGLEQLLDICAGAPLEASAVLEQTFSTSALTNVHTKTLLNTGLRAQQLRRIGYGLSAVAASVGTGEEVSKFGF